MIESIRLRLVNDPITTLLFVVVQKSYKNTMMVPLLYIFISSVI